MGILKRICICVGLLISLALYSYIAIEVKAGDEITSVESADARY
jgi:hypothetical protein